MLCLYVVKSKAIALPSSLSNAELIGYTLGLTTLVAAGVAGAPTVTRFVRGGVAAVNNNNERV